MRTPARNSDAHERRHRCGGEHSEPPGMGLGPADRDGGGPPGLVRSRRRCWRTANWRITLGGIRHLRCGLVVEIGDGPPNGGWLGPAGGAGVRGGCVSVACDGRRRLEGEPAGGPTRAGFRVKRPAWGHVRSNGIEQRGGIERGGAGIEGPAGVGVFVLRAMPGRDTG